MYTTQQEEVFILNHLNSEFVVLEYGSGESTLIIQNLVKKLTSIEHNMDWYKDIKSKISNNVDIFLCEPDLPYLEGNDDGDYETFKTYINKGLEYGPYDLVYIDGRARVGCALKIIPKLKTNALVFIHDFVRSEYQQILKIYDLVEIVDTMAKLKLKI